MAVIVPIKGVRYDSAKVGAVTEVITPPYDVIDAAAQNMYYERNPYNVIRLELNQTTAEDNETNNRYTRAAHTFRQWLSQGVLVHDPKPSLYLYQQEFQVKGETLVRSGFICGVKAEDYSKGSVLPHEETLPKHKADRLDLMRASLANFSPIFGLYSDPQYVVETLLTGAKPEAAPDIEVVDDSGVVNRLWVISDADAVAKITQFMADKQIFIADGHHRYETAVNFGKEMSTQGKQGYDFVLIALVNLYDKGLVVFPTHRLVHNVANLNTAKLITALADNFLVEKLPASTSLDDFLAKLETAGESSPSFGVYTQDKLFYLLKLQAEVNLDKLALENRSNAWKRLDVSILHTLVLDKHLGIGSQQCADESNLTYTRDEAYALRAVENQSAQLCFFMNPTKVEEVTSIATGGEKMPQKSTYFYPKIVTGLVINDLSDC